MREIKFRFYGVNAKKMYLGEDGKFTSNDLIETEDWKVMQYTGLKDCNGKEVFEGDLIPYCIIGNRQIYSEVIFKDFKFCLLVHEEEKYIIDFFEDDDYTKIWFKVSGNIYENQKELEGV